jgi:hypothetical protein
MLHQIVTMVTLPMLLVAATANQESNCITCLEDINLIDTDSAIVHDEVKKREKNPKDADVAIGVGYMVINGLNNTNFEVTEENYDVVLAWYKNLTESELNSVLTVNWASEESIEIASNAGDSYDDFEEEVEGVIDV